MTTGAELLSKLAGMIGQDGTLPTSVAPGTGGPGAHPDLAAHDLLGLATQTELDGHANAASHTNARTPLGHSHPEADVTNLTVDLAGKALAGHNHDATYAGTSDPRLSDARIPTAHAHLDTDIPASIARDAEVAAVYAPIHLHPYEPTGAVATHAALADPHPIYLTQAEANALYSLLGHTHAGGADPVQGSYAPGSFTVTTGRFALLTNRLTLTGSQRATVQGTGRVRIN